MNFRTMQAANRRKTIGLLMGMGALMWCVVYAALSYFGGTGAGIVPIAVGISLISVWGSYYGSDKLVLTMTGAKLIQESDNPKLFDLIHEVIIASGLPMPKVAIVIDDAPNAFATGRDPEHAIVAATTGLLVIMDDNELEGVMAHELAHIRNYDIRVSTIVFGLVSAIGILADFAIRAAFYAGGNRSRDGAGAAFILIGVVASVIAWFIGPLVSAAVSRQREYLADATGIEITRYPEGLASALNKLGEYGRPMKRVSASMAHMFLNDPIKPGFTERLFSTHPPIPKRIERIQTMGTKF